MIAQSEEEPPCRNNDTSDSVAVDKVCQLISEHVATIAVAAQAIYLLVVVLQFELIKI